MKINLKTHQLNDVLDMMRWFVSKHSTLPILENIYIKGNIDTITLRATDMEKYIEVEIPATVSDEWSVTINAKLLSDIAKSIDWEDIQLIIDTTKNTIKVKSESDDFAVKGLPASEYVSLPEVKEGSTMTIDVDHFVKGISSVEYAITEKNFSPILTGLMIRVKTYDDVKKLVFVGTDSFRLAEYKIPLTTDQEDTTMIVPKMNIWDIKRVIELMSSKGMKTFECQASDNLAAFRGQVDNINVLMTSLLIQWNFPDYENENIMPTQFKSKIMMSKDACDKAIKKIWILTKDINNYVQMTMWDQIVTVQSGLTDMWEWVTTLSSYCEWESVSFGLNGKYISDYIRILWSKDMVCQIAEPTKPLVFTDTEDDCYTYIIRPLMK